MSDEKKAPSIEDLLDEAIEEADAEKLGDEEFPDAPWMKTDEDLTQERLEAALRNADVGQGGPARRGDKVTGEVVHIGAEDIFVDIGGKAEALLSCSEMRDKDGNVTVKNGEVLTLYVSSTSGEEVRLSYKMALEARDREAVREAYAERTPVQGKITGQRKGGCVPAPLAAGAAAGGGRGVRQLRGP
jgi:S1 RNA binding domain